MSSDPAEEDLEGPIAGARTCSRSDVAVQYKQHHKDLHKVANRIFDGRRPDAAEDAVMDVFLRLARLADEGKLVDQGEGWLPYLRRAVRNSSIDIVRKENAERENFPAGNPEDGRTIDLDPLGDAVVTDLQTRQRVTRLRPALAILDATELAIVKHKFWDQWTDKRVGEAVGTTGQAVGQRLKTILKKLHKEVTKDE